MSDINKYLPDALVARKRYRVHLTTIWRWDRDPSLNFPRPLVINKRKYRDVAELDAWDATRIANQTNKDAA